MAKIEIEDSQLFSNTQPQETLQRFNIKCHIMASYVMNLVHP